MYHCKNISPKECEFFVVKSKKYFCLFFLLISVLTLNIGSAQFQRIMCLHTVLCTDQLLIQPRF